MQNDGLDEARVRAELEADAGVVRSLRAQGDVAKIPRAVDVRFVGSHEAIEHARVLAGAGGWLEVQTLDVGDGEWALDLHREQTTEDEALRDLTLQALRIEASSGARYDGWGTVAQTKRRFFGIKFR